MKRCPECIKDYLDDSLLYCLDDGAALVPGSITDGSETAILTKTTAGDEGATALLGGMGPATAATAARAVSQTRFFKSRERLPWLLAALLLAALVAASAALLASARASGQPEAAKATFSIHPPGRSTGSGQISISPDGRQIAMLVTMEATNAIWLRPIDSLEGRVLAGTEGAQGFPFWSPDSRSIAFQASVKLKRIDLADGSVRDLADLPSDIRGFGGTWNRDGTIIYFQGGSGLLQISASGGQPKHVPGFEPRNDGIVRWPSFLPDGKHFLFLSTSFAEAKSELGIGSIATGERKMLMATDSNAIYAPPPDGRAGYILFARGGSLVAQVFDPDSHQLIGESFRVAERVRLNFNRRAFFSVSENGNLIYDTSTELEDSRQIAWYDRSGKALGTVGQPGPILNIELSPDERFLAISRRPVTSASSELVIFDLQRGATSRLGTSLGETPQAVWSSDGRFVVWNDSADGKFRLIKKLASGAGETEVLLESPIRVQPTSWSSDGRFILYSLNENVDKRDIWVLPLDGERQPQLFFKSPGEDRDAFFSPDGKYVAYTSEESGRDEIYVQTFPASANKWPVSTNGGFTARWGANGREIVYGQPDGKMMSVAIRTDGTFEAGVPQVLFDISSVRIPRSDDYSVSRDGQKMLFISRGTDGLPPPFVVVLNWSAGIAR